MTTKQKLVLLELAAGVAGWGAMIAGAGTLYYSVLAIGFGGSWKDAGIALGVCWVGKWLAKGFQENKMRVTFVARMVAEGMTEADANAAWLRFVEGKAGKRQPSKDSPQRLKEQRERIVNDYASHVEANPTGDEIRDVAELPHPKAAILDALLAELKGEGDRERREAIATCAVMLADYQPGIGRVPLTSLGIDLSKPLGDHVDVAALAKQIATNPNRERYQEFQAKAQEERQEILRKVAVATAGG
ncbi:exported hypothetical protein [uncultured Alphaproteobacteria bacterium]|uniref:Uncharacterized protein n=1 Tax=uncultured Alphaproteobacteria bacterium TaxID=91750 RepID=A0A212KM49_9PROT|nr:exported hypothetical protein [uncultured Alphaproteobacteria bacterium]